jgi:hypothetical protein
MTGYVRKKPPAKPKLDAPQLLLAHHLKGKHPVKAAG